jgi:1-acyl-sn-glycerol-3-phosphate acyltransferase
MTERPPEPADKRPGGQGGWPGLGFTLAVGAAAVASWLLFRFLNRMQVEGLDNIPEQSENVLYCLNHNSILDNFAFETAAYIPKILLRPEYVPVSLADRKKFFGDPHSPRLRDRVMRLFGRHFLRHLKAYPVDRQSGDLEQVDRWAEMLRDNIVIVFPEGTRSRTGEIGPGKPGVGKLIYQARPVVIPVYMAGMREIMGVGRRLPRVFKRLLVRIGRPLDLDDLLRRPLPDERSAQLAFYAEISGRVIQAIKELGAQSSSRR